ncbi:ribosomal protein L7/L12 [Spiractinospora alimapuensis]|uniref:ribosomal protein L7/L12 n=1 Tax=Spiractinospora alimapuensis TaxID=2820884 RepID=UPI001F1E1DE5|nr:ribosomal protein L7/L12 [Spiractinospora alimapuensis]QVQ52987.1 ribosomal protein L7/L12 [Spiractinospora alimapuensis]
MVFSFFGRGREASTGTPDDPVAEVYALVSRDRKIQAIKVLRGATGWGLREAKDVVDRVGRGEAVPELHAISVGASTPPPGTVTDVPPEVSREIRELMFAGKKIQAIKVLREATGWSLKDAKSTIDRLQPGEYVHGFVEESVASRARAMLAEVGRDEAIALVTRETGMTTDEATRFVDVL